MAPDPPTAAAEPWTAAPEPQRAVDPSATSDDAARDRVPSQAIPVVAPTPHQAETIDVALADGSVGARFADGSDSIAGAHVAVAPVPTTVDLPAPALTGIPSGDEPVVMQDVSRSFGKVMGVDGISLVVPAGTILGVIGPSGSGKTTTVRTLTGALAPDAGRVRVLGEDPRQFSRRTRERIGYMPQSFVLYPDLTARENVDFVAALFGMLWGRRRRRVREALQLVDLYDARNRRASDLSGGMQRRLELACALVHEPTLFFLDEPTAGIDPLLRQSIWDELRRLRDDGRTLLVTTQYVGEAEYCDQVALIAQGKLIALETPDALRRLALGGEVLEVETGAAFDGRVLPGTGEVTEVRQRGPRDLLVVVSDDAGEATPRVAQAISERGADIVSIREYRPSFDEVFTLLVQRDLDRTAEANGDGNA